MREVVSLCSITVQKWLSWGRLVPTAWFISSDVLLVYYSTWNTLVVNSWCNMFPGVWYYEVILLTAGVMQIGWATKDSKFLNHVSLESLLHESLELLACRQDLPWMIYKHLDKFTCFIALNVFGVGFSPPVFQPRYQGLSSYRPIVLRPRGR